MTNLPEISPWQRPTHAEQRALVCAAWLLETGKTATTAQAELAQAITGLETCYGSAWKPAGMGSCNHGAVQHKCPPCKTAHLDGEPWKDIGEQQCFSYADTHPNADGSNTRYAVCFRRYPNHLEGARDVVRWIVKRPNVLAACSTGIALKFSGALHASGYFEGFGKTVDERIANHAAAVSSWVSAQRKALGGAIPDEYPQSHVDLIPWQEMLDENQSGATEERDDQVADTPSGT